MLFQIQPFGGTTLLGLDYSNGCMIKVSEKYKLDTKHMSVLLIIEYADQQGLTMQSPCLVLPPNVVVVVLG